MAQNLSNLALGTRVKFGRYAVDGVNAKDISWIVVAKNHYLYPDNSVTLMSEKVLQFYPFDAFETNATGTTSEVNVRYSLSNIDQWLNKNSAPGKWYTATHTYDRPPSLQFVGGGIAYDNAHGFLYSFTKSEIAAILDTEVSCRVLTPDNNYYETITRKVFLPSTGEMGYGISYIEGTSWGYFTKTNREAEESAPMTPELYEACPNVTDKPESVTSRCIWWTRSGDSTVLVSIIPGGYRQPPLCAGIRPVINLSADMKVSDTIDTDGKYVALPNIAPTVPAGLNVPLIYGGQENIISWGTSYDSEGGSIEYELEVSNDGGDYVLEYRGSDRSHSHYVEFGARTVSYRVRAVDDEGATSDYITSATISVVNNYPPVISGENGHLGNKSSEFTVPYTITDEEDDVIIVTEAIDGEPLRTYSTRRNLEHSFEIKGISWVALTNGVHTLSITAHNENMVVETYRTYTFTKDVKAMSIRTAPMVASAMPTRISISVTKNIPADALYTVEVCNNGNDASPTWEDATHTIVSNMVHNFSNKTKTADTWAVMIKVSVDRNGGEGACYISSIGGNFE